MKDKNSKLLEDILKKVSELQNGNSSITVKNGGGNVAVNGSIIVNITVNISNAELKLSH